MESIPSGLLALRTGGNTVGQYLTAGLTFLAVVAGLMLLRAAICSQLRRFARAATGVDEVAVGLARQIRLPEFLIAGLYAATRGLSLHPGVDKVVHAAFVVAVCYRAAAMLQAVLLHYLRKSAGASAQDAESASSVQVIRLVLNIFVWTGAVIVVLENLGVNISAVVAGLGIGGVAVALATQQILGDIFSSFVIFMDKPFRVGDLITLEGVTGTVETMGIKSTRLRSPGGELILVPNRDLTTATIRNFEQMQRRRVVLDFAIDFSTPMEALEKVTGMVQEAVASQPSAVFDRAHLTGFGDPGILFEASYFVQSRDLRTFMDVQHAVGFRILKTFKREGVAVSQPSMAVTLQKAEAGAR